MNTQNTIASPYHSKVRSTQNMGVPLFSCLGYGAFGEGKVFSENSKLTCNVSMKMVNKLCVSDRVYTFFKKTFLLFHIKCFIYSRVGIL